MTQSGFGASDTDIPGGVANQLQQEYEKQQTLFYSQPPMVQRFLLNQAGSLAEAIIQNHPQVHFSLPDRIVCEISPSGQATTCPVPAGQREQLAGGLMERLTRLDLRQGARQRLIELEQSPTLGVSVSGSLLRYATALHMVHNMLPAGRSVTYTTPAGEEIPSVPVKGELEPESAITAATDAIVEDNGDADGRGELLVPYVPAARRFYLPQWVAFDDQERLLVNSVNEAEAHIASMQRFLDILHASVALTPYMVADQEYQLKRYGMLGQLVNQGRALAGYITSDIIATIKRRAAAHELNRGLSLSLPYFDDQELEMRTHNLDVIPSGRIMFVPAFVVHAAREEQAKVAQDTRLSPSTRKYLLAELKKLELAFYKSI
jgi:hypothetical protein